MSKKANTAETARELTGRYPWNGEAEPGATGFIWSADRAREVTDRYDSRLLKQGLLELMGYIKAAADAGRYACTVYDGVYNSQVDIKLIVAKLQDLGYDVGLSSHLNEWAMTISWAKTDNGEGK